VKPEKEQGFISSMRIKGEVNGNKCICFIDETFVDATVSCECRGSPRVSQGIKLNFNT
jgi:hypothetical protein